MFNASDQKTPFQNVSHFVIYVKNNLFFLAYCVRFVIFLFGRLLSFLGMSFLIFSNINTWHTVEVPSIFDYFFSVFPHLPYHCESLVVDIDFVKDIDLLHASSYEEQLPVSPGLVHVDKIFFRKGFKICRCSY